MSDLMLCGVLRMPMPHDPSNLGLIEWMQIKQRMAQAANELEERAARIEALERQVKAADALAEAHGKLWSALAEIIEAPGMSPNATVRRMAPFVTLLA